MVFVSLTWFTVGALTIKLGTLMYHDESSSKQKLQGCKQQQTASGSKWCLCLFVQFVKANRARFRLHTHCGVLRVHNGIYSVLKPCMNALHLSCFHTTLL